MTAAGPSWEVTPIEVTVIDCAPWRIKRGQVLAIRSNGKVTVEWPPSLSSGERMVVIRPEDLPEWRVAKRAELEGEAS